MLSLPLLPEGTSRLATAHLYMEVDVCAHLLLRRLLYYRQLRKQQNGYKPTARRTTTSSGSARRIMSDCRPSIGVTRRRVRYAPEHPAVLHIQPVTCIATSDAPARHAKDALQEKGDLQEAALINPSAPSPSPPTVTESFSLVERLAAQYQDDDR
jgi:hypothetical protein